MSITTKIPERFCDYYVEKVLNKLFESERNRLNKWILSLCQKHTAATGGECYGFKYKAERFIPKEYESYMKNIRELPTLNITLADEVIQFYAERQRIGKDAAQIKQLFAVMLMKCESVSEARHVLPECVVTLLDIGTDYPRTVSETEYMTLAFKEQYDRLLPKIQMYSVIHLINS